jgi:hypothetical protein
MSVIEQEIDRVWMIERPGQALEIVPVQKTVLVVPLGPTDRARMTELRDLVPTADNLLRIDLELIDLDSIVLV